MTSRSDMEPVNDSVYRLGIDQPAPHSLQSDVCQLSGLPRRSSSECGTSEGGRLAQLVEHRLYTPAVTGSSPVPPTKSNRTRARPTRDTHTDLSGVVVQLV